MAAIRQLVGIDKDAELIEAAKNGKCDVIEKLMKKSTSGSSLLTNLRLVGFRSAFTPIRYTLHNITGSRCHPCNSMFLVFA